MVSRTKFQHRPQVNGRDQIIHQIQDFQNELAFWKSECNYFLQLLNWERAANTSFKSNHLIRFEKFLEEDLYSLVMALNDFKEKWEKPNGRLSQSILDFRNQRSQFLLRLIETTNKYRSMKVNALEALIDSYPLNIH